MNLVVQGRWIDHMEEVKGQRSRYGLIKNFTAVCSCVPILQLAMSGMNNIMEAARQLRKRTTNSEEALCEIFPLL